MGHESPATSGKTGLGHRRSVLKWLAALPVIGAMVPVAAVAAQTDTPYLSEACLRQIIAYRAKCVLLPGLWAERQDNPKLPEMDLIVGDGGNIELLVARPFIFEEGDRWRAAWIARHRFIAFAEIEDGTFTAEFYPRLRKIMERYT